MEAWGIPGGQETDRPKRFHVLDFGVLKEDEMIPCPEPGCQGRYSSDASLRNHLRRKHKDRHILPCHPRIVRTAAAPRRPKPAREVLSHDEDLSLLGTSSSSCRSPNTLSTTSPLSLKQQQGHSPNVPLWRPGFEEHGAQMDTPTQLAVSPQPHSATHTPRQERRLHRRLLHSGPPVRSLSLPNISKSPTHSPVENYEHSPSFPFGTHTSTHVHPSGSGSLYSAPPSYNSPSRYSAPSMTSRSEDMAGSWLQEEPEWALPHNKDYENETKSWRNYDKTYPERSMYFDPVQHVSRPEGRPPLHVSKGTHTPPAYHYPREIDRVRVPSSGGFYGEGHPRIIVENTYQHPCDTNDYRYPASPVEPMDNGSFYEREVGKWQRKEPYMTTVHTPSPRYEEWASQDFEPSQAAARMDRGDGREAEYWGEPQWYGGHGQR